MLICKYTVVIVNSKLLNYTIIRFNIMFPLFNVYYTHIYIYIYIYICVCVYICICVYIYVYAEPGRLLANCNPLLIPDYTTHTHTHTYNI